MTFVGTVVVGGGVVLLARAPAIGSIAIDIAGGWVVAAIRGLGILLLIVGAVFLSGGIANVVELL